MTNKKEKEIQRERRKITDIKQKQETQSWNGLGHSLSSNERPASTGRSTGKVGASSLVFLFRTLCRLALVSLKSTPASGSGRGPFTGAAVGAGRGVGSAGSAVGVGPGSEVAAVASTGGTVVCSSTSGGLPVSVSSVAPLLGAFESAASTLLDGVRGCGVD